MLSIKHPLVAGAAVLALVGAAGVAQASGGSGGSGRDGHDNHGFSGKGLLHGEFVRALRSGGTELDFVQNGVVKKVTANSLTVRSKDGFKATYVINGSTHIDGDGSDRGDAQADNGNDENDAATIQRGDQVSVLAVSNEEVKVAMRIHDDNEHENENQSGDVNDDQGTG